MLWLRGEGLESSYRLASSKIFITIGSPHIFYSLTAQESLSARQTRSWITVALVYSVKNHECFPSANHSSPRPSKSKPSFILVQFRSLGAFSIVTKKMPGVTLLHGSAGHTTLFTLDRIYCNSDRGVFMMFTLFASAHGSASLCPVESRELVRLRFTVTVTGTVTGTVTSTINLSKLHCCTYAQESL